MLLLVLLLDSAERDVMGRDDPYRYVQLLPVALAVVWEGRRTEAVPGRLLRFFAPEFWGIGVIRALPFKASAGRESDLADVLDLSGWGFCEGVMRIARNS
jgi:hypothetical protein